MWVVTFLKPFVYLWAGLNLIDSISFGTRVARLLVGTVLLHSHRKHLEDFNSSGDELCSVCDDVMGDLLAGNDGLSSIPCRAACLGFKQCIQMCEAVQEASATSTEFPCVAAGFCHPEENENEKEITPEELLTTCQGRRFFQCKPSRYCHRVRRGLKWPCELRPGIKRWTGMKQLAKQHTAAIAEGILSQKHCGEPDAGPYCIARPQGISLVSDMLGNLISILVGGYKSIVAIESPGGGDDRQWLIFWLMQSIVFFVENNFARVLLSNLPFYFEVKLLALIWLIWWEGADLCYRRLKRFLQSYNFVIQSHGSGTYMQEELKRMQDLLGEELLNERRSIQSLPRRNGSNTIPSMRASLLFTEGVKDWEYEPGIETSPELHAMKEFFELSVFLLSADGAAMLASAGEKGSISKDTVNIILEKAAACASFQPRHLHVNLLGSLPGPEGQVPTMDSNGLADPYVVFRLIPSHQGGTPYPSAGVKSSICYKTLSPLWNQRLEIPLRGGEHDESGYYKSQTAVGSTKLHISVHDADVGIWSVLYHLFRILAPLAFMFVWLIQTFPNEMREYWTQETQQAVSWLVVAIAIAGYVTSYIMAVIHRSDDESIGECLVPLSILMDQGEHALLVTLRPPSEEEEEEEETEPRQNSEGGYGVIRLKLSLSEN